MRMTNRNSKLTQNVVVLVAFVAVLVALRYSGALYFLLIFEFLQRVLYIERFVVASHSCFLHSLFLCFCKTFRWPLLVCEIVIYVRVQNGNGSAYDSEQIPGKLRKCVTRRQNAHFSHSS